MSADYVVDVPYLRNFVGSLAPPMLRLVAALNGVPAPPESDFDYCELGCGFGDTTAALAAANPDARFVGVDFNADHIAFANTLVSGGGLRNARFLQMDFDDLANADLPDFDFLAMHGVWSWIAPAKRRSILAFARARLKPHGLLCTSYNALPGWAALEPIRRLIAGHAESAKGSTLERARAAFAFVERLAATNTGYFAAHPTARAMLDVIRKSGPKYVVHEYLGGAWEPMYFADVAREMSEHGLGYVGRFPLHLNAAPLTFPPSAAELAREAKDRVALETLKDFTANEHFRIDVYAPGSVHPSQKEKAFYFEGTPFGTLSARALVRRKTELPHQTLDYTGADYDAILAAIAERAATAVELARRPELVAIGQARIGNRLQNLIMGGQVVPMRSSSASESPGSTLKIASAYNALALEQALAGDGPLVMASPVTGTAIQIAILDAIAVRWMLDVAKTERHAWAESFLARRTSPLSIGDRVVQSAGELMELVTRHIDDLFAGAVPKMVELGLLARSGP